jgi:T5SS/PEP-CTERM-associated repeat protein
MVIFYWNNPAGGEFQNHFNWNTDPPDTPPIRWPGFGTTIFNLDPANFITPFYRVEFLHDALSTDLIVENPVEFDLNGFTFSLTNSIVVGDRTKNAALTLRNGTLQGANANLGRGTNSKGQVTVSGNGAKWELPSTDGEVLEIGLGLGSQGTLIVENGGQVINNGKTRVGEGGTGTILVTGAGSLWRNAGRILLGAFYGTGIMNVEAGGRVESQFGVISGDRSDSTGTGQATISGSGSTWQNAQFLTVGESRQGTLLVENGGLVSNTFSLIGLSSTGVGTVTVKDNGSTWNNSEYLDIGIQGNGTLNILNGGLVTNVGSTIGVEANSTGRVTVNGAASLWNNSDNLEVGYLGNGVLDILAAGKVKNTSATVGHESGSTGTVTVDGNGSIWNVGGLFTVGDRGIGTLNIRNGGTVSSLDLARIGDSIQNNVPGEGTVTIAGNGSIWNNTGEVFVGNFGKGTLNILDGGQLNSGQTDIAKSTGSTGTATVSGTGSIWNNTGELRVGMGGTGILTVASGGLVKSSDRLRLGAMGTLQGSGTVEATLSNEGGVVSPGLSAGILNLNGNYSDTATAKIDIEIGGLTAGTRYDQFNIAGSANFSGTLNISFINGFTPQAGDRFDILTYGSSTGTLKVTGLDLGGGRSFVPMFDADGLTFAVFNDIVGTNGNNFLRGTSQNDQIKGLGGDDILLGNGGDDLLYGDAGNDLLDGGLGHDQLYGGDGHDQLLGGSGNDILVGSRGCDVLKGGNGDDLLDGGKGNDILFADSGVDRFVLRRGDGKDIIWNFIDRQDSFLLADGLHFEDLKITQGIGGTLIQVRNPDGSSEILASLIGVNAKFIGVEDFAILPTANPGLI